MKNKIMVLIIIMLLTIVSYGEDTIWKYEKDINVETEYGFNSFKLDKEVYKNAEFDLSDLRVVDESDCYIPFYISKDKTEAESYEKTERFKRIGKYVYKEHMFYEFASNKDLLKESTMADELILSIDSSRDYFQYIDVYGSFDSEHWDKIKTDSIYRIEKSEDLKISFDRTEKYPYYRLVIREQQSDVDIVHIESVAFGREVITKNYEEEIEINEFIQKEDEGVTELRIETLSNAPIRKLVLDIDGMYKRPVEVWLEKVDKTKIHISNTYIYQSLVDEKNVNREIELFPKQSYEALIIRIINGSDSPLFVEGLKAVVHNKYLVMETEPEKTYRLIYGNTNTLKPNYDIESFRDEIESEAKGNAVLGNQKDSAFDSNKRECNGTNKEAAKKPFLSQKRLFDGLIVLISIVLVLVLLKSMSSKKQE